MNNKPQPQFDISNFLPQSTAVTSEGENHIFVEGVLLRKISKFLLASDKDGIIPIPCFYDPKTGEILLDMLPQALREEYKQYNESITKQTELFTHEINRKAFEYASSSFADKK